MQSDINFLRDVAAISITKWSQLELTCKAHAQTTNICTTKEYTSMLGESLSLRNVPNGRSKGTAASSSCFCLAGHLQRLKIWRGNIPTFSRQG